MLPKHIAVIMDGNGRWAKQRQLPLIAGHRAGMTAAKNLIKHCAMRNISALSVFAFSSENWSRSAEEVNQLMDLFLSGLEQEAHALHEQHIQLRFLGERNKLAQPLTQKMTEIEQLTHHNTGMTLLVAVDYGGQWDILQAVQRLIDDREQGLLLQETLTAQHINERLSFADLPHPDLFIRTSGEIRISNFMLWQLAYSELYFTDVLWPDFDEAALEAALTHFATRDRRYGGRIDA